MLDKAELMSIYDQLCTAVTAYEAANDVKDYNKGYALYQEAENIQSRLQRLLSYIEMCEMQEEKKAMYLVKVCKFDRYPDIYHIPEDLLKEYADHLDWATRTNVINSYEIRDWTGKIVYKG